MPSKLNVHGERSTQSLLYSSIAKILVALGLAIIWQNIMDAAYFLTTHDVTTHALTSCSRLVYWIASVNGVRTWQPVDSIDYYCLSMHLLFSADAVPEIVRDSFLTFLFLYLCRCSLTYLEDAIWRHVFSVKTIVSFHIETVSLSHSSFKPWVGKLEKISLCRR